MFWLSNGGNPLGEAATKKLDNVFLCLFLSLCLTEYLPMEDNGSLLDSSVVEHTLDCLIILIHCPFSYLFFDDGLYYSLFSLSSFVFVECLGYS